MKTILLKHLAQLNSGFTIRESIDYLEYGEVKAVQIKDLSKQSHQIDTDLLTGIEWRYDSKPQYLSHNAILLTSRGELAAYLFKGDIEDKVVASNSFIIINIIEETVLPEFMVWYLNNAIAAKNYFSSASRGSSLPITTVGERTACCCPHSSATKRDHSTPLTRTERKTILRAIGSTSS